MWPRALLGSYARKQTDANGCPYGKRFNRIGVELLLDCASRARTYCTCPEREWNARGPTTSVAGTMAQGAPIIQDPRLHQDFGYHADTDAADRILQGTYNYPADMDPYTKLLLQEAHHIFSRMSKEEVVDFVTITYFHNFGSTQTRRSSRPNLAFILATTKRLPVTGSAWHFRQLS